MAVVAQGLERVQQKRHGLEPEALPGGKAGAVVLPQPLVQKWSAVARRLETQINRPLGRLSEARLSSGVRSAPQAYREPFIPVGTMNKCRLKNYFAFYMQNVQSFKAFADRLCEVIFERSLTQKRRRSMKKSSLFRLDNLKAMLVWIVVSLVFGCAAQQPAKEPIAKKPVRTGRSFQTITVANQKRSYLLYIPANYNGQSPVPLVFDFHGTGGNPINEAAYSDSAKLAEKKGFVLAAPAGLHKSR
ncbi:MAG: hypothetical protein GY859_37070, partial [Desulfobacterales bacterium]|nr:hypothetical protein [Desulfobacterales bacterium]